MAINLEKITLDKTGDSHKIDLSKGNKSLKEIIINLTWTQEVGKKGFWASILDKKQEIDLDLGCFFQLNDGQKSVIDGLQFAHGQGGSRDVLTRQGRFNGKPWIWHTGDDRSGASEGENILINPHGVNDLQRIIVYCFIYEGVAKWSETNAVATIKVANNPDVVVEMGKQNGGSNFCALAELLFDQNNTIIVKKLVTFHNGHAECDKAYKWGMKWQAGTK